MKPYLILTAPLILLLLLTFSCSETAGGPYFPSGELTRELTLAEEKLVEADQHFSYELFRAIAEYETEQKNLMISPLSISMALAMTMNGAEGETYKAMKRALPFYSISVI